MGECDLVSVIHLLSDKCSEKELEKLACDYDKDLKACAQTSKFRLHRYLKSSDKSKKIDETEDPSLVKESEN